MHRMILGSAIIFISIVMAETKLSFLKNKNTYMEEVCVELIKESENEQLRF